MAIFVFDTQVTGQRNIMIENAGKVAKRKGMNSVKYSITKMDIKTEMRTDLYLQNKIKFNLFIHHQYQDQVDHIHKIFSLLLRLVTLTAIVLPRQKT